MVAGASGVVPPAADGAGEPGGNKVLAWQAPSLEASSMLRMCRASGNSVRTEMRGWADDGGVSGRSRSVAARRTSRRRPSGKATAMKAGPRPQVNDSSLSTCPNKGCRGSVTVTLETTRSKLGADRSVRGVRGHRAHAEGSVAGKAAEFLDFGRGRRSKQPKNLDTRLSQKLLAQSGINT
jgi:hypothetical protein